MMLTGAALAHTPAVAADISTGTVAGDVDKGRSVWRKKGQCAFCHGWSGDGRGHPRSPGVAANLRQSELDRDAMGMIISCGIAGTAMPYHDRAAYLDGRCFGMSADDFEPGQMPEKGKTFSPDNLENLLAFIFADIKGKPPATLADCETFYKPGSRNCDTYR